MNTNVDTSSTRDVSERRHIIGGSSLGAFEDTNIWGCQRRLAYQFLGFEESNKREYNEAMALGHFYEPHLRELFSEVHEVECIEGSFVIHPEFPFLGGHPDGVFGDTGIIEIKTASERSYFKMHTSGIYESYQDQLTLYMAITERYNAYFVIGCYENIENYTIVPFPFNKERYNRIIELVTDFVCHCQTDLPPRKGKRGYGLVSACRRCEFRSKCDPRCLHSTEARGTNARPKN